MCVRVCVIRVVSQFSYFLFYFLPAIVSLSLFFSLSETCGSTFWAPHFRTSHSKDSFTLQHPVMMMMMLYEFCEEKWIQRVHEKNRRSQTNSVIKSWFDGVIGSTEKRSTHSYIVCLYVGDPTLCMIETEVKVNCLLYAFTHEKRCITNTQRSSLNEALNLLTTAGARC